MFHLRNLFEPHHSPVAVEPQTDRRQTCRYEAVDPRISLGWWVGDDFHTEPASLHNISLGGAAVALRNAPPPGPVWFHAETEENRGDDWLDAEVVHSEPPADGFTVVHLHFPGGCPYDWFRSAVYGHAEARAEGVAAEFDERYWK